MSSSDYDEAINLAKSSLVNTIKIVGADGLPASEKFFQLGNCYFKAGKKQEALTNYLKTKDVLASNKRTHTREFGVVLLKLAILELNFGKISQAIDYGLDCLGIFERE
jgi:tetratricopeptide (TPR) repeat protein